MNNLTMALLRSYISHADVAAARRRDERGDVPGWVMITVMTAGIVVLLAAPWSAAREMLKNALTP